MGSPGTFPRPWLLLLFFYPPSAFFLRAQAEQGLSFREVQTISKLPPIRFLRLADVDGDGDLDLFLGSSIRTWDLLFINHGKGRFKKAGRTRLQSLVATTFYSEFQDVDGDGDLDLCLATDRGLRLLFNDGKGFFREKRKICPPLKGHFTYFALGDLDGDKDPDLLISMRAKAKTDRLRAYSIRYLLNDGNGSFSPPNVLSRTVGYSCVPVLLDMNKDGRMDVLEWPYGECYYFKSKKLMRIFLNMGHLKFKEMPSGSIPFNEGKWDLENNLLRGYVNVSPPLGDLDGDGFPDLVLRDSWSLNSRILHGSLGLFLNRNGEGFEEKKKFPEPLLDFFRKAGMEKGWEFHHFLLYDLDNDGDLDIAAFFGRREKGAFVSKNIFLQNNGKASFRALPLEVELQISGYGWEYYTVGDLNKDGSPDLIYGWTINPSTGNKPLPKGGTIRVYLQEKKGISLTRKTPTTQGGKGSAKKKK